MTMALIVGLTLGGGAAFADDVDLGLDYWETVQPTYLDFAQSPLPADFFGPGSDPFDGVIYFQGEPIDPGSSGEASTIVERQAPAHLPDPLGSFDTIPIQMIELQLRSIEPITVTFWGGIETYFYEVFVTLDPMYDSTGEMTIFHQTEEGGVYDDAYIDIFASVDFVPLGPMFPISWFPQLLMENIVPHAWRHDPLYSPLYPGQGPNFFPLERMALTLYEFSGIYGEHGSIPPREVTGCCFPDGSCVNIEWDTCLVMGGTPMGQSCFGTSLPCCLPDGSCAYMDPLCCELDQGGVVVPTGGCAGSVEACCDSFPPAGCMDADAMCCGQVFGGTAQGQGTACQGDQSPPNGVDDACESDPCGDGDCIPPEDQCNCPQDCGTPPPNETPGVNCQDSIDNDCDSLTDCDDVHDCIADPACQPIMACCLRSGACVDRTHDACVASGGDPQGPGTVCAGFVCSPLKWAQPPTFNYSSPHPECFWGWDEPSEYFGDQIVADDWLCDDPTPITDIHWWGSYHGWNDIVPPQPGPVMFHIGIWTDVPAGFDYPWSHPGTMLWEWTVDPLDLNERPVACDFHPDFMTVPDGCFRYDFHIPLTEWFYQEPASTIYWLSIAPIYLSPTDYPWGWKTREHFYNDDAVRILWPTDPVPGSDAIEHFPIEHPPGVSWDMSFVLTTVEQLNEACCMPDGSCVMMPEVDCWAMGGVPQGPGTTCTTPEACCFPDGTCANIDPLCCDDLGGIAQGPGTVCTAPEACCFPDDTCAMTDPLCCDDLGGTRLGPGSTCGGMQACCTQAGDCYMADATCCIFNGDTPQGPGTVCLGDGDGDGIDDACEDPEACCLPDGSCLMLFGAECMAMGGIPQGNGTVCTTPEACCWPDDTCAMVDPLCCGDLGGTLVGPGSTCGGRQACCTAAGACYMADGACCLANGHTPKGPGTNCTMPNICGSPFNPPDLPTDPVHQVRKHRYLSVNPGTNPGVDTALKVEVAQMRRCQNAPTRACLIDSDCDDVCDDSAGAPPHYMLKCPPADCSLTVPPSTCIWSGPCVDMAPSFVPPLGWIVQDPVLRPDGEWTAPLSHTVYSQDWSAQPVLHIGDCGTVPCVTYHVYACDPADLGSCSDPLEIATQRFPELARPIAYPLYGDVCGGTVLPGPTVVPPDQYVNVKDLLVAQLTLINYGSATLPQAHMTWVDLHGPGVGIPPQYILNVADLQAVYVFGFANALPWVNTQGGLDPQDCP
jgi:hypothetical protein